MQKKKQYSFVVLIEQDSDGWFVAKVPDIQGCYTQGKTVAEAMERVKEAIQVCLEADELKPTTSKFIGVQNVEVRV
ncbi:MAG TPA: type II toxin-antitoxin system HicB family antitoxin [archaeon]|nr:type II toxin-antitoxin system HicB family antitoxin [archaeon]